MLPVITIDGPAGVGKTTTAALLGRKLCLPRLDTGAMFRYFALQIGDRINEMPNDELARFCAQWKFSLAGTGPDTLLLVNGNPVGPEIRSEKVGAMASKLGTVPAIRDILRKSQQQLGAMTPLVAEGRDLGTVVFPKARFKFFLDASPAVRAKRRWLELAEKGIQTDFEELSRQIRQRDEQDRTRSIAPLMPAKDAVVIDTSSLTIDEVACALETHIKNKGGLQADLSSR